jgi:hypothetical protein
MSDRSAPFQGLVPYHEFDADYFFGREREIELIADNLRVNRLTILYGPSGVGKTSVLRAGVANSIATRAEADQREFAELVAAVEGAGGTAPPRIPTEVVVVYDDWRSGRPIAGILEEIRKALPETGGSTPSHPPNADARQLVQRLGADLAEHDVEVLLILDQFEEFFRYPSAEQAAFEDFLSSLTGPEVAVNTMLSLRDDALSSLDRFKGRLPGLFDKYLRIDHLTWAGARESINRPLERWNEERQEEFKADGAMVERLLDQLDSEGRIEAALLSIVMLKLFEHAVANERTDLTIAAVDDLGGVGQIIGRHIEQVIAPLIRAEREIAAAVFGHLVTPSGAKIAHRASDLADFVGRTQGEIDPVLEKLTGPTVRILRRVPPPTGDDGPHRFEIYHDLLGPHLSRWSEQESGRAQELAATERGDRNALILGIVSTVMCGLPAALFLWTCIKAVRREPKPRPGRWKAWVGLALVAAGALFWLLALFGLAVERLGGNDEPGSDSQPLPSVTISLGDTEEGSIAEPGEVDRFAFVVDSPAAITLTMRPTGDLDGVLEVEASGAGSLARVDAADAQGVETISIILADSGTYDVPVQGASGSVGDYQLSLQAAQALVPDDETMASIDGAGEADHFPFDGRAGDAVTIVLRPEDELDGIVTLLDPSGAEIAGASAAGAGEAEIVTLILPTDGTYVARVRGAESSTGPFSVTLRETEQLTDGRSVDGAVDVDGEIVRYPFEGTAGTAVTVALTPDATLNGVLEVLDPGGARIERADSAGSGQPETITVILPVDGTYVVPVAGRPGSIGSFALRLDESTITEIGVGDEAGGAIGESEPVGVFRFPGRADALVTIVARPDGTLDPAIDVLDPGAVRIDEVDAFGQGISETATVRLREDGEYVVFVRGRPGSAGEFGLEVVDTRTPLGGDAAPGTITSDADLGVFEFEGGADDVVQLVMQPVGDDRLDGQLGLFDPDGREIRFVDDEFAGDAETILTILPQGGTYVAVARGFTGSTGAYELTLESLTAESVDIDTATGSSIDERGDVAVFRFTAPTPGSRLQVDLRTTAALEFDVIDPDVDVVVEGREERALLTLRREGEYHVVVRGRASSVGDFTLDLSELSVEDLPAGASVDRSIDQADEFDVYEFFGAAGAFVELTLEPAPGFDARLDLLDASTGEPVCCSPPGALSQGGPLPDDGAYLVYVTGTDGSTGDYTLTFSYFEVEAV